MKILAVNNDADALRGLLQTLKEVFPSDEIISFTNSLLAIKHLSQFPTGTALVFVPLLLRPMHSFDFVAMMRRLTPGAKVIFTTQTENCELSALVKQIFGAECMVQPITIDALRDATSFLYEPCPWENCEGCVCDWCSDKKSIQNSIGQGK